MLLVCAHPRRSTALEKSVGTPGPCAAGEEVYLVGNVASEMQIGWRVFRFFRFRLCTVCPSSTASAVPCVRFATCLARFLLYKASIDLYKNVPSPKRESRRSRTGRAPDGTRGTALRRTGRGTVARCGRDNPLLHVTCQSSGEVRVLDPDSVPEKPRMEDLQDSTVWQHDIQVSRSQTTYRIMTAQATALSVSPTPSVTLMTPDC